MAKIIIVTGLSATGKSTIARRLADQLSLPLIAKDAYKERMFDALGVKDREWSRSIGKAAIDMLYHELEERLRAGHSAIVESNFRTEKDNKRMGAIVAKYNPEVVQILCKADGEVVLQRFIDRIDNGRHPGHCDAETVEELRPQLLLGRAEPLNLPGKLIEIDTTNWGDVDFDRLLDA